MKTVTLQLTPEQLRIVMRALSHHIADLVDDDGKFVDHPFLEGSAYDYYRDASAVYFDRLRPLQTEVQHG